MSATPVNTTSEPRPESEAPLQSSRFTDTCSSVNSAKRSLSPEKMDPKAGNGEEVIKKSEEIAESDFTELNGKLFGRLIDWMVQY